MAHGLAIRRAVLLYRRRKSARYYQHVLPLSDKAVKTSASEQFKHTFWLFFYIH